MHLGKPTFAALRAMASTRGPVRIAIANAAHSATLEALKDASEHGIATPLLIGEPCAIESACRDLDWKPPTGSIFPAVGEAAAAAAAVSLARAGDADAVMKGDLHTDVFMRALLEPERGLRIPDRRVSHIFVAELPSRSKLLGVTDAAINIHPDLSAKAQICQNAIDLFRLIGIDVPRVAVLSAVEFVTPSIASSLDAACLTLMASRGQIKDAIVDGPLALDNAISARALEVKGISSPVAEDADILLVPDLVAGNILAKNLEYLANATLAGIAVGLAVPAVLTSRADPADTRSASLALAALMHQGRPPLVSELDASEPGLFCAPQPEHSCRPVQALQSDMAQPHGIDPGEAGP